MHTFFLPLFLLLIPFLAQAQPAVVMEDLVLPFTVAEGAAEKHQAWLKLDEMKGVNWRGGPSAALFRKTNGDSYRDGTLRLRGYGKADLMISGDPYKEGGGMQTLEVGLAEATAKVFEYDDFGKIMRAQFPHARLKLVQPCKISFISGSDIYEVTYAGRKPVLAQIFTDSGGSAPKSRGSMILVTRAFLSHWSAPGCN